LFIVFDWVSGKGDRQLFWKAKSRQSPLASHATVC
jgi:hypothetical protein